jgi:hypothetical protein
MLDRWTMLPSISQNARFPTVLFVRRLALAPVVLVVLTIFRVFLFSYNYVVSTLACFV